MITLRQFPSFQAFVDFAETPHPNDAQLPCFSAIPDKYFTGVSTKEEAFFLCRTGYAKGTEAMRQVLETLKSQISLPCEQYQFVPSIEGNAPDVQAYIQGIPEDMLFMEPIAADAPPTFLNVQMDLSYAGSTPMEKVKLAGATIYAAQEALKAQGCQIQLTLCISATKPNVAEYQASFPISSNIDLDTFAFIYTHPAFLRVLCLSAMEKEPLHIRQAQGFYDGGGYGYPLTKRLPNMDAHLHLAHLVNQCTSIDAARIVFQKLVDSKFNSNNK